MRNLLIGLICLLCLGSCRTMKDTSSYKYIETIVRDTVKVPVRIEVPVYLPSDTVFVEVPVIVHEPNSTIDNLNIAPWFAESTRSKAEAGVKNNKPYLNLIDKEIDFVIPVDTVVNSVNTTVTTQESSDRLIVKTVAFWDNQWFWISCILGVIITAMVLILILQYKSKIKL